MQGLEAEIVSCKTALPNSPYVHRDLFGILKNIYVSYFMDIGLFFLITYISIDT